MAAQVDMALDLSAKPVSHCGVTLDKAPSPCPSMSSELDTSVDRPSSAFSDKDSDRSFPSSFTGYTKGMGVKPVSGPVPMGVHLPGDQTEDRLSPTDSLTGSKPFKMYPFDSMPNVFSQLASNAASMTAAGLYSPYAGAGTPSLGGMLDGPLSLSSPITQYIQQKKRRSESRLNSQMKVETPNGMSSPSDITSTSALSPSASMHGGFTPNSPSAYSADDGSDGYNGSASKRQKTEMTLDDRREMSYRDRRVKNNEAAKRSRDARRMKEEEIAMRAAFLEQENLKLRAQVTILKNETTKLHYMLYNRM